MSANRYYREENRAVDAGSATLSGTLTLPATKGPWPVTLLLGGTFSDLRDADVDPRLWPGVPKRGMYAILARGLAEAGIASFRFDRRGAGESTGELGVRRAQEVADAGAVWRWVRSLPECNQRAAMLGHSAGAYVLCRVAHEVGQPDAAVLQGALYRTIAELLVYNYGLVREYLSLGQSEAAWVRENSPKAHEDAMMMGAIVEAIENREPQAVAELDGETRTRDLSSLRYDLDLPPEEQFRHLSAPTLVLHASEDLNVPVEDAFDTVRALWAAGNRDVELRVVPGANHSFQLDAEDCETRVQEKITMKNFGRPFHPLYPAVVIHYLARKLLCPPPDVIISRAE
ncbi:MAG: alpha/beta fold hydrolase [bacterium]|nr:alpha/beta fold hydrolase [bacterium]MDE0289818.1 alpha/beta fold hydrolase [bacterium]MDE0437543.1 alpha/beta fold hydrolase [bacterium]